MYFIREESLGPGSDKCYQLYTQKHETESYLIGADKKKANAKPHVTD